MLSSSAPPSRRTALLAAMISGSWGCQSPSTAPRRTAAQPDAPRPLAGGLTVLRAGRLREDEKGGYAIVLLHGWGAPGDDLLSLAQPLAHPRARFFVPAAPLPERGGGRAWWHLDASDRPVHAWDDTTAPGRPHPQVTAARTAVQALVRDLRARYAPDTVALVGFSQGAMLALDVALAADPPVDRVALLSGVLLADSLTSLHAAHPKKPPIFVAHGREDHVLPFEAGARAVALLEKHGHHVSFHPFDGGHEIPPEILAALRTFLFDGDATAGSR